MHQGIIFKGIGGFYYVKSAGALYECKARGKFKNEKVTPMVGDHVGISIYDEEKQLGVIEEIMARKNSLVRPAVSNVDQAIIVFSIKNPDPNLMLLDKMIVLAEHAGLDVILCFNKSDLDVDYDFDQFSRIYTRAGYRVINTCAIKRLGIDALLEILRDKISVFSGPSGVGKSSLLNAIEDFAVETGEVSEKIKRGRHTTRHSELFEIQNGGIIVDTPGFTSLSLADVEPEILGDYFPEFRIPAESCRFDNCSHINEPECGVKEAIENKLIESVRYDAYLYIYKEITEQKRRTNKW
ncbi:MAG: ribosome small subunit-dependent GTPase A [Clostridiales bacterium 38-18]|nr:MAG: ribosome small subunit-dependent GTPase A [Clostridiales bacterium 38-18]